MSGFLTKAAGEDRELLDTVKTSQYMVWSRNMVIVWSRRPRGNKEVAWRKADNARNNARCTQARKTTHGLNGQHQDVDRTPRGTVNQNDRGLQR